MKYKLSLSIAALLFLMAFLITLSARTASQEALAARIAPDILRFHILAESNKPADQALKLSLRDYVLSYINENAPACADKAAFTQWLSADSEHLENSARQWLQSQGSSADVQLTLTRDYFPTKTYDGLVFPCGAYDAARLTIGEGQGHNWWCVLYPSLCFTDSVRAVVPETSREQLSGALSEEDYEALCEQKPEIHVRLRLLDLLCGKNGV